ncbi:putative Angiopoietin-related protein 6 [Hypsibius exemplaris]|uniref:Angiopoietin-related protein 6 n=1 Tax=Hypsibius exemplaris TaxID=2072580 RepID=A0A1W0XEV9_HYPEX|nr:putative Angiopoietin-related protein 6 [Hypsibius exemplaris]
MAISSAFFAVLACSAILSVVSCVMFPQPAGVLPIDVELRGMNVSSFRRVKTVGRYSDCQEIQKAGYRSNGIYQITLKNVAREVGCYYTKDNKAYTIIQQRVSGNIDFDKSLVQYADGFGTVSSDHWIGLTTIRHLVELGNNQLQIVMSTWAPGPEQTKTATYGYFSIGTQSQGWPLSTGSFYGSRGLVDDMAYSNGRVFYTSDVPDPNRCAVNQRGGWWYNYCAYAFLNGYYYRGGRYTPPGSFYDGIYWKDWMGFDYSLQQVTMAVTHS